MENIVVINLADLQDPDDSQGRSYRQVNAEKKHKIPVGSLVETDEGTRLFVKKHTRDCDQTPLYSLGPTNEKLFVSEELEMTKWVHGYSEDSLKAIK